VLRARRGSAEGRAALSELCEAYYQPVLTFLRCEGRTDDVARDLAHDFFARILSGKGFEAAAPERGRFRSYVLGALKHFLADQRDHDHRLKRGGGVAAEPIEPGAGTETSPALQIADPTGGPDEARFDRDWALAVMDRAVTILAREYADSQKGGQFKVLKQWLTGEVPGTSQAEAAKALGMTEGALKVAVHRMRKRFREVIRAEIAQTLQDPAQLDDELRHLIDALV